MVAQQPSATVLALHHGYRVAGGEERAAEQLAALAEGELGERVQWLRRDSGAIGARAAAVGLLRGGSVPEQVAAAVIESGADLVHAHNLFPTFGPAALRAARGAGAAVVVHLHNYRLVCAVATNVRDGRDCTECHVGNPLPGVRHRCRGALPEALAYGAALPRWQRAVPAAADAIIVPSRAARDRLQALGVALPAERVFVVGGVACEIAARSRAAAGRYALAVGRLAPEKDLATAIDACAALALPLVIAGEGPERARLQAHAAARAPQAVDPAELLPPELLAALPAAPVARGAVVFVGRVDDAVLAQLRDGARIGLATSTAHETFGLSALESMAAALPTAGSAVGALPELLGDEAVAPPRDAAALTARIAALAGNEQAGLAAAERARSHAAPARVSAQLAAAYAAARRVAAARRAA